MLYEIRDYHYRPEIFPDYRKWAEEAVPVLREQLDLVGFWIDDGVAPEVQGAEPMQPALGQANVTWIIRWQDKADRDANFRKAFETEEWKAVWARHPDPNGYLQTLARFMTAM